MKLVTSLSTRTAALAAALVLFQVAAGAQTITLTNPGPDKGATNYVNDFNGGTSYSAKWTGADWVSDGTSTFWAYCIDPKTTTKWGQANTYASASLNSFLNTPLNNTNPASTGYQQQMSGGGYGGLSYSIQNTALVETSLMSLFSHAYDDSLTTATKAAAFGYAVWEIMGESTYARTSGALKSRGTTASADSDALETQINAYLSALTANSWANVNGANLSAATSYVYTVYYDPTTHTAQNFIKVTPTPAVPEPATLALVGAALLGMTSVSRRRARRQ